LQTPQVLVSDPERALPVAHHIAAEAPLAASRIEARAKRINCNRFTTMHNIWYASKDWLLRIVWRIISAEFLKLNKC